MKRKGATLAWAALLLGFACGAAKASALRELAAAAGADPAGIEAAVEEARLAPKPRAPRIGYLTGVFNPAHLGHMELVREAMRQAELDAFIVMPTPATTHNEKPVDWELRLEMARLAFASIPGVAVIGSDWRADFEEGGTGQAIRRVKGSARDARWVHVMGADSYERFVARGLLEPAVREGEEIVVVSRAGSPEPAIPERLRAAVRLLRLEDRGPSGPARSSTLVRRRRAQGLPIGDLVAPEVEEYIRAHDLYSGAR